MFKLFTTVGILFFSLLLRAEVPNRVVIPGRIQDSVIIIKEHSRITTIQQMLEPFKGKAVFVNLWTTRCDECWKEFGFKRALQKYLRSKNIEMLYVSFGGETNLLWQKKIRRRNLEGYHIQANPILWDEIQALAWGSNDISFLPFFLLFDRNGTLASKTLSPPSTGRKLFQELDAAYRHAGSL